MANNLTLYSWEGEREGGLRTPNGQKASITLQELGPTYKIEQINIMTEMQREPCGAIMLYLADKYDKDHKISYPHGSDLYYEMLSWLMIQMGGVGPMQSNHFVAFAKARSDYAIERYMNETKRLYSVLEIRLSSHDSLAGDKFTLADIANFAWVRIAELLLIDLGEWLGGRSAERSHCYASYHDPGGDERGICEYENRVASMENTDKH
ncbi:glutathione S-transferase [Lipomyces orientalis]|uniref:Glutathione S-transferase n=1 Tax=Lipomyces orientalis TaxID=1233043 RepID=A0ACC3TYL1_9ASCO